MATRIAVGFSEERSTADAFAAAADDAIFGLGDVAPGLCVVFAGGAHLPELEAGLAVLNERLGEVPMIGCGAGGVVAPGRELEDGPGVIVWLGSLPDGEVETFPIISEPGGSEENVEGLPELNSSTNAVVVLADPYSCAPDPIIRRINSERAGLPVLGGLASAAIEGAGSLILDGEIVGRGAVGCAFRGIEVIPCVSQGATPIGPELAITRAEGNVIHELAFEPALTRIGSMISELDPEDREKLDGGLLIGVVIDENQPEHERGDFLVRPVIGADRESGAVAVGEQVRVGQTVRIHIRDGDSADADLREALALQAGAMGSAGAAGALMFTCNGRGRGLFGVSDHDADAVDDFLSAPVGGFFCAGEIGPVGGRNFLHGFTATLAVFPAE